MKWHWMRSVLAVGAGFSYVVVLVARHGPAPARFREYRELRHLARQLPRESTSKGR